MTDELRWDPYDTAVDVDPHPVWKRMRDEQPVYRNEELGFWALSRYADVDAASRDTATFSSSRGTVLELMGTDMSGMDMIIFQDPPVHDMVRALVSRAFTPRRIAGLGEGIREICAEYLDPLVGSGGFDYLGDFGTELPSRVISALLGVPASDRPRILELINTLFYLDPEKGMINDVTLPAQIELHVYIAEMLSDRRANPRDDMLTALVEAELTEDGVTRRLTDLEAANFGLLLASAGTETVARLLGWAAVILGERPDQLHLLASDPGLIPDAVEELLRYEAPSPVQGRTVTTPVEFHGVTLQPDDKVLLLTGSAGRDERVYPDADTFDVRRKSEQHLSLGLGPHYCLGSALARLEGRIALEETLKRFPSWSVDREHVVRLHTSTVRGHKNVPIVL